MPLLITDPILGDINTISIPIDAIYTVSLFIVFSFIGYFFLYVINNGTKQFPQKTNTESKIKLVKEELEDPLAIKITTLDPKTVEKPRIKKLNLLPSAKLLGLGSLAAVGIGGASLLGLQSIQQLHENMSTSQTNLKRENKSKKHQLSMINSKSFYKQQKSIKRISYIDPFLSNIKSSRENNNYQVKEKQIRNIFSF